LSKIILVDTFNLFIRCFSTSKELNENGLHIGAITNSVMSLYNWINRFNPDVVFLCYEGKKSGLRRRHSFHDYKDGRRSPHTISDIEYNENNAFWNELKVFFTLVEQMPVCNLSVDFLEADDVISYLTKKFQDEEKIIISTDEDYYQLISDNTSVFSPTKTEKVGEEKIKGKMITKKVLLDEYKIIPENWVIRKTLLGDKSDNIKKDFKGIGNKTIQKLFPELAEKEYGIDDFWSLVKLKQNDNKKLQSLNNQVSIYYTLKNKYELMNLRNNKNISVTAINKLESSLKSWKPEYDHFNLNLLFQKNMIPLRIQFSSLSSTLRSLCYASTKFKESKEFV
jgi:5'-3' exonuclease